MLLSPLTKKPRASHRLYTSLHVFSVHRMVLPFLFPIGIVGGGGGGGGTVGNASNFLSENKDHHYLYYWKLDTRYLKYVFTPP